MSRNALRASSQRSAFSIQLLNQRREHALRITGVPFNVNGPPMFCFARGDWRAWNRYCCATVYYFSSADVLRFLGK